MKRIAKRWQAITEKAAEIKQVIESVPPKVADIREAIAVTTGQIQQMRTDVQNAVAGLQADTEERLVQSLREIDVAAPRFLEAGFKLTGVDMELGLNRRLLAHFTWEEELSEPDIRAALTACQSQKTVHAMLSALVQAGRLADRVQLANMGCEGLVVHVGPSPSVRVCWRTPEAMIDATPAAAAVATTPAPAVAAAAQATVAKPAFTTSSFFEPRAAAPAAVPASVAPAVAATPAATTPSPLPAAYAAPAPEPGDWKRNALDRFKRMPNLGPKTAGGK